MVYTMPKTCLGYTIQRKTSESWTVALMWPHFIILLFFKNCSCNMNFITLKYLIISVKKGKPHGYVRLSIAQHHKITTTTTTPTNIIAIHMHTTSLFVADTAISSVIAGYKRLIFLNSHNTVSKCSCVWHMKECGAWITSWVRSREWYKVLGHRSLSKMHSFLLLLAATGSFPLFCCSLDWLPFELLERVQIKQESNWVYQHGSCRSY